MTECVLMTIADICHRYPQSTAIVFGDKHLTYRDLSTEVSRIALLLESYHVTEGSLVAVSVERSEKLLPILLGIWCVGAAYLPIDPAYPQDRKEHMLTDGDAVLAIVDCVQSFALKFDGDILPLDILDGFELSQPLPLDSLQQWRPRWQLGHMAYMIYTSGSTGLPKGIAVSQFNVQNFLLGMLERPGLSSQDKLLATTTVCFDIHVLELFLPLVVGATVHIVPRYTAVSGERLRQYIHDHHISVLQATPTTWRMLLNGEWKPNVPLKILVGGEPFPSDMTGLMLDAGDSVWNMYGPTETTVWSTCYQVRDVDEPIRIGTPIRNTQIYVVDDNLKCVQQGEIGELLIGGDGVSMGYHNQDEKNRQSFIDSPFCTPASDNNIPKKLYRTGDLVKQLDDSSLVYVQRKDDQFKIRGYRIEAGDVEAHIMMFNGVTQAVVTVNQIEPGDDRLVAHVKSDGMLNAQALRNHCKKKLPHFMVPQHFNQLDQFPQTENGKIDRKTLSTIKEFYSAESLVRSQFSSARDDLDLSILEVWRRQLSLDDVGIDDNFIDLGGNSILAVKLSEAMQRVTGVEFQPDALFRHKTVRELVDSIGENKTAEAASVVHLNQMKDGVPIFCLSGVQVYQDVADALGDTHPIYAIYAREELALANNGNSGASLPINNLTQAYIEAIKRQSPKGPYILAGLSFGGMLAIDVAHELSKQDEQVELVVMFDSCLSYAKRATVAGFLKSIVLRYKNVAEYLLCVFRSVFPKDGSVAESCDDIDDAVDSFRIKAYEEASERFESHSLKYSGQVLLIKAEDADFGFGVSASSDYGWKRICGDNLFIDHVKAGHIDMMHAPKAVEVGAIMQKYIGNLES